MIDKLKIGSRLRAARKAAGFKTALAFCEKFAIPLSTYSQNESGIKAPRAEALKNYADYLGVNLDWLKTGLGMPITGANIAIASQITQTLSEDEIAEELLSQRYAQSPIDESLLSELLKVLLEHFQAKNAEKIDLDALAKATAGLYNNLRKMDTDPLIRSQLIRVAVETYFKFCS